MTRRPGPLLLALGLCATACGEGEPAEAPSVPQIAYCDPVRAWDPALAAFEDEVLELVNERRLEGAMCGEDEYPPAPALSMDPALRCAARIHALDMGTQDYFSNLDPEGLRYSDRAELAEYAGLAVSQNIGAAHYDAEQLVTALMGSTGPCRTLMNPDILELGMGYALASEAEYSNYWTQVYGVPQ